MDRPDHFRVSRTGLIEKNGSGAVFSCHLIKFFKFQDGIENLSFKGFVLIGDGEEIEKLNGGMFLMII